MKIRKSILAFLLSLLGVGACAAQSITALTPSTVTVGSPAFTLVITGTGFSDKGASKVFVVWNGAPRSTQFVSSTKVTAQILASDLTTVRQVYVTVCSQKNTAKPCVFTNKLFFNVVNAPETPLTITGLQNLPDGKVGQPFLYQLKASGGTLPYKWSVLCGSLPSGLVLTEDGWLSGSSLASSGSFSFEVMVMDSSSTQTPVPGCSLSAARSGKGIYAMVVKQ